MKIGILTQPLQNNYGGLLQNYALQHVLLGLGHDVETIDHGPRKVSKLQQKLYRVVRKALQIIMHKPSASNKYIPSAEEYAVIRKNTNYFINKYISRTQPLHSKKEFDRISSNRKYKAYVVGSDQCWRPLYNNNFLPEMYLRFVEKQQDVKKIAYAASFGVSEWEYSTKMTKVCSRLAKKFDLITVRERNGVLLCQKHLGVNATFVLDPTMLLDRSDYEALILKENEPNSKGDLFYYILDPSKEKETLIDSVAKEKGFIPFSVLPKCQAEKRTQDDVKNHIEDCVYPSVTSWLRAFMDAKMVIVDSFHGAVFSIIFNKPFWVIGNQDRGIVRFESLLETFGLEDRMIEPNQVVDYSKAINWKIVNKKLKSEQTRCLEILADAFKGD